MFAITGVMQGFSSRLCMGVRSPRHVRRSPHLLVHIFRLLSSCCLILPAHWYRGSASKFAYSRHLLLRNEEVKILHAAYDGIARPGS